MEEEFERARALLTRYEDELRNLLPADAEIFDAHVHLGHDIDGQIGVYEELERINDADGVSHCFMFCMDEPDRHPAFRAPNDRTLEYAKRSEGRLIPFVRLDLTESPIEEAERCLDLGARGIKLHPRAQRFMLNDERLAPVFAIAATSTLALGISANTAIFSVVSGVLLRPLPFNHPEDLVQIDETHLGWAANIGGARREWQAEIVEQVPDQKIAWRATSGNGPNGLVVFEPLGPDSALVTVEMSYEPDGLMEQLGAKAGLDSRQVGGMTRAGERVSWQRVSPPPVPPVPLR